MKKSDKTRQQLVDELQELKERMKESEATLRDLPYRIMVETMNEGAVSINSEGTILFCNQRFADIIKESMEKVVGSSIYQYFSSKNIKLFEALLKRGLKRNSKSELSLQAGGDNSVPVLISISAIRQEDIPRVLCLVITDLTDQKRNEEMRTEEVVLNKSHDILEHRVLERTAELRRALSEIEAMKDRLEVENIYFRQESKMKNQFENIIGQSDGLKYVLYRAQQVSPMNTTVLILGETGTGKELIAAAIHNMSTRKERPLITVNCAALPGNLIESELFGREKGAFTGADVRRMGRFEIANGSTLCLDEIGELPLELQGKLLRVIQHNEFERLGSSHTVKVDVRLVATTNRDLEKEVREGRFRQDLYYRLNVFPITVPPLRLRKDDIPLMAQVFMERYSRKLGKQITMIKNETMKILQDYPWPGNVRELESIIERAVILCPGPVLQLADKLEISSPEMKSAMRTLEDMERSQILKILSETKWRIEGKDGAAAILGIHPSTLRARLHKLGVVRPETK
jgi:formate hydrogenlyase transcriptional activator